ncbi:hypothetical protein SL054_002266 [Flavobacterium psychrophilum]|nr:hypothetical protein [Flavobacterium psychrophilum]
MELKKYKLRAECSNDVVNFLNNIHTQLHSFKFERWKNLPDCQLIFSTELALDEIQYCLLDIEDCHVMAQTVMPYRLYTGKRNYELTKKVLGYDENTNVFNFSDKTIKLD